MYVLALDTTTRGGSVAIVHDDVVVVERAGRVDVGHVERLPHDILIALAEAGVSASAIDVWAVAAGPGGFTGLRVGLATAQGFALALDKPTVGVPTLAALTWWHAERTGTSTPVGAWVDAFRGDVFAAAYAAGPASSDGWPLVEVMSPTVATPADTVATWRRALPPHTVVVGATGPLAEALAGTTLSGMSGPPTLAGPVGRLAWRAHRAGASAPPHALAPVYVRRPDAVVERERRQRAVAQEP